MTEQVIVTAEHARDAFESIINTMKPMHVAAELVDGWGNGPADGMTVTFTGATGDEKIHPVFALSHHFRANDNGNKGYTANPTRGDHMTVPFYTESGRIGAFDIGFHKGDAAMHMVVFLADDLRNMGSALAILQMLETR